MLIDKMNTLNKGIKFDENILCFLRKMIFFINVSKKQKIYLIDDLIAHHEGGSIKDESLKYECFKKWHWEWSKYYFLSKHYNKFIILLIAFKSIFKFLLKSLVFYFFNKRKYNVYLARLDGILSFYLKKNKIVL